MQAVECKAELLVGQLRAAASPQQQASVVRSLVAFCGEQKYGKEWSDAGGSAGVLEALVQAAKMDDAALQIEAVTALGILIFSHPENQSAAAAAGAIALILQFAKSSDAALQKKAVWAFGHHVSVHPENQSAAGAAGAVEQMCSLLSTSLDPDVALTVVDTLNDLCTLSSNAIKAVSLGAVALLTQFKGRYGDTFDGLISHVLAKLATVPRPAEAAAPLAVISDATVLPLHSSAIVAAAAVADSAPPLMKAAAALPLATAVHDQFPTDMTFLHALPPHPLDSANLPSGWFQHIDNGLVFYVHPASNVSQWQRPRFPPPPGLPPLLHGPPPHPPSSHAFPPLVDSAPLLADISALPSCPLPYAASHLSGKAAASVSDPQLKAAVVSSYHLPSIPLSSLPPLIHICGSPGASATVFKIEYQGKDAAVKRFHEHTQAMLRRELKSMQLLTHPNIVPVLSIITDSASQPMGFVMEYVPKSLDQAMQHLTTRQALHVLSEAALGLAVTHDARVIHSDIKPDNILCSADFSTVKLADFGLAHAITASLSSVSGVRGTALFMAPELHADAPLSVLTDIFSFGMTAWQLFHPAVVNPLGANIVTISLRLGKGERPAFTRPDAPVGLKELVSRCLEHEPSKRPSSMWEVYGLLKAIMHKLQSQPVFSQPFAKFDHFYSAASTPQFAHELLSAVQKTIFKFCEKVDGEQAAALAFFKELELEAFLHASELSESIAVSAGLMWTSQKLLVLRDGRALEFCSILNLKVEQGDRKPFGSDLNVIETVTGFFTV
jgi:hypothetical protein